MYPKPCTIQSVQLQASSAEIGTVAALATASPSPTTATPAVAALHPAGSVARMSASARTSRLVRVAERAQLVAQVGIVSILRRWRRSALRELGERVAQRRPRAGTRGQAGSFARVVGEVVRFVGVGPECVDHLPSRRARGDEIAALPVMGAAARHLRDGGARRKRSEQAHTR